VDDYIYIKKKKKRVGSTTINQNSSKIFTNSTKKMGQTNIFTTIVHESSIYNFHDCKNMIHLWFVNLGYSCA